jgi:hypothetical protein
MAVERTERKTRGSKVKALAAVVLLVISPASFARVMLRWTADAVPSTKEMGISELVVAGNPLNTSLLHQSVQQGYKVYVETSAAEAAAIADSAGKYGIAGIIVNPGDESRDSVALLARKLRASYPRLKFLIENTNALQPKMRGTLVINRNGVLQATSPTAQPWINTNLALVKLERAISPRQPPLYSFAWDLSGTEKAEGPVAADYALAIAESGAFSSDLILKLNERLQEGLAHRDKAAWDLWSQERKYLQFYSENRRPDAEANVAIVTGDSSASFEPVNLLVRHNVSTRVFRAAPVDAAALRPFQVVVFLAAPSAGGLAAATRYARQGGTLVLVNDEKKSYPWHSIGPRRSTETAATYPLGKGQVIELLQPVSDPESFAQDIRALIPDTKVHLILWNALTVVGLVSYENGKRQIELLNYSGDPVDVQVRVKGSYNSVSIESPEHGCCTVLASSIKDGFTEFSVPSLKIAGRIHLESRKATVK